jgi:hypothetical protein
MPDRSRPAWAYLLRDARRARGWDAHRLAVELRRAAGEEATASADSLLRRIRDWEAGRHGIRERYRLLLASILDLDPEQLTPPGGPPVPDVSDAAVTKPTRNADQAQRIRDTSAHLVALDELTGGSGLVPAAVRAAWSAQDAARRHGDREVAAAAAEALQIAGWLAYDADQQDLSRTLTMESVLTARMARARDAELFALSQLAMQNAHLGIPGETRQLCEQVLADELPRRVGVLFTVRLARALGQTGERRRAVDLISQARSALQDGTSATDPAWAWWLTDAEITWHEGMVDSDVGDWKAAVPLLALALDMRSSDYRRGALNDAAHLAHALARLRSWTDTAQVLEHHVLPAATQVASGRTSTLLTQVLDLIRHAGAPTSVQDLAEHACRPVPDAAPR